MPACISPVYLSEQRLHVPCGKCNFCLERKRSDWTYRLLEEQSVSSSSFFITMTYDDLHLVYSVASRMHELHLRDVQLFTKRLRKAQSVVSHERLRYYTVGEYGTKFDRPHYHSIMFNLDADLVGQDVMEMLPHCPDGVWCPNLAKLWRGGIVHIGMCTNASIHYVTKYVINRHMGPNPIREPPFATMSRKPGLGASYIQSHKHWQKSGYKNYVQLNGFKQALPRYYKERMFEPWERDHLARVSLQQAHKREALELERLERVHPRPYDYYDERLHAHHDSMYNRLNEKSKF